MAPAAALRGLPLFKDGVTLETLEDALRSGSIIKLTHLTDSFGYDDLIEQQEGRGILLFALSPDGIVHPFSPANKFRAGKGWRIASLFKEDDASGEPEAKQNAGGPRPA